MPPLSAAAMLPQSAASVCMAAAETLATSPSALTNGRQDQSRLIIRAYGTQQALACSQLHQTVHTPVQIQP